MSFTSQYSMPAARMIHLSGFFLCFLISLGSVFSQGYQGQRPIGHLPDVIPGIVTSLNPASGSFVEMARDRDIPARAVNSLTGVNGGYYAIAGVFGSRGNAEQLAKKLGQKGFESGFFYNSVKNSNYVYLQRFTDPVVALDVTASAFNGRYKEDLWLLEVRQAASREGEIARTASLDREEPQNNRVSQLKHLVAPEPHTGLKSTKDPAYLNKLIEKADNYFDKMWYAEAAKLYETVLEQLDSPSSELIRKAGDSHYFNTDMERAYYWYDRLYKEYKNEMSAENLFQYAHALKGTGKYGRAKRINRLYNRKLKAETTGDDGDPDAAYPGEVVLDNILSTEEQVTIHNLAINSKYSDFGPMFHNDQDLVFASAADSAFFVTRRYKWNNQPFLDLYVGKINEESQEVRDAIKFSKKVNTKYHEAGVTFSPDNTTMYFTRNNYGKKLKRDKNGVNNLKIYRAVKTDGEWGVAEEVPFNNDEYSTGHPALSPDGKQMYFVSDMPGSMGATDIFVVDIYEDGGFSEPRNLGPEINTAGKEMFPYINESKLYFASNGHVGMGGLDMYEVAYSAEDGFLEVRNMGQPINSNRDDFSLIINEVTQQGFFSSNRTGGKGDDDIYSFSRLLPEEVNQNAIAGVVTEMVSGDIVPEALITLLDQNNRKLKEVVAGADGTFLFEDLENTTHYMLHFENNGFQPAELQVETGKNEKIEVAMSLERLDDRILVEDGIKKLKSEMVYFDFDKSFIRSDAQQELDKLVGVMQEYPDMVIRIESHTDSRGPAAYNKYLSDKRAKATRDYLIKQGITPLRIDSAIGYGEERLLNSCDGSVRCSETDHQRNRRSEFIVVSM
jgi:outer membrane protein OmpA-like peptidoglycan-associated protein